MEKQLKLFISFDLLLCSRTLDRSVPVAMFLFAFVFGYVRFFLLLHPPIARSLLLLNKRKKKETETEKKTFRFIFNIIIIRMCWVVCFTTFNHATHADKTWPCVFDSATGNKCNGKKKSQTHVHSLVHCWWLIKYYSKQYGWTYKFSATGFILFSLSKTALQKTTDQRNEKEKEKTDQHWHRRRKMRISQSRRWQKREKKSRVFIFLVCLTEFDSDDWFSGKCLIFLCFLLVFRFMPKVPRAHSSFAFILCVFFLLFICVTLAPLSIVVVIRQNLLFKKCIQK